MPAVRTTDAVKATVITPSVSLGVPGGLRIVAEAPSVGLGISGGALRISDASKGGLSVDVSEDGAVVVSSVHHLNFQSGFDISESPTGTAVVSLDLSEIEPITLLQVLTAPRFVSNVAIGTQPYACTSTTVNTNLNADLWDGYQFADYLNQALLIGSSPTFAGATLSGITEGSVFFAGAGGLVSQDNTNLLWTDGTNTLLIAAKQSLGPSAVSFQPAVDSTTFLQVLDADGGVPILNVDATNERVGIGMATPVKTLDVAGDIVLSDSLARTLFIGGVDSFQLISTSTYKEIQSFGGQPLILNRQGNSIGIGNVTTPSGEVEIRKSTEQLRLSYDATNYVQFVVGATGDITVTPSGGDLTLAANLTMGDAKNIILNATTGTKIGTATTQKLGFWNAAPAGQQATIADADGTIGDITTKFNTLLSELETIGILAAA